MMTRHVTEAVEVAKALDGLRYNDLMSIATEWWGGIKEMSSDLGTEVGDLDTDDIASLLAGWAEGEMAEPDE